MCLETLSGSERLIIRGLGLCVCFLTEGRGIEEVELTRMDTIAVALKYLSRQWQSFRKRVPDSGELDEIFGNVHRGRVKEYPNLRRGTCSSASLDSYTIKMHKK